MFFYYCFAVILFSIWLKDTKTLCCVLRLYAILRKNTTNPEGGIVATKKCGDDIYTLIIHAATELICLISAVCYRKRFGKATNYVYFKRRTEIFQFSFFCRCNSVTMPFEQSSERPEYNR